ncbi:MAG: hypothetical protein ABI382_13770, partial [Nakamurella sp.]
SGGVGASFVDAAEAGASISVGAHWPEIQSQMVAGPSACGVTPDPAGAGAGYEFSTARDPKPFDLTPPDSADTHTATVGFTISNPNASAVNATWTVESVNADPTPAVITFAPGQGSATIAPNTDGPPVVTTFTWPAPEDGIAIHGDATITVTCTPANDPSAIPEGDQGTQPEGDSTENVQEAARSQATYTLHLAVSLPATEPHQNAESGNDEPGPACATGDSAASDSTACPPVKQSTPGCEPGGADFGDSDKCAAAGNPASGDLPSAPKP